MRALQARELINVVKDNNLVEHTAAIGSKLYDSLEAIIKKSKHAKNLRGKGQGTFIAWDFKDGLTRDKFVGMMRLKGVSMGGCGDHAVSQLRMQRSTGGNAKSALLRYQVRLRPMLIFGEPQAEILLEAIERTLSEM